MIFEMNRKGAEDLLWNILLILLFLAAAGILFSWMNGQATGKSVRAETAAKQAALLIDLAKPGTTIFVNANLTVEGNKVLAVFEGQDAEYSFVNNAKISYQQKEGGTEILVG